MLKWKKQEKIPLKSVQFSASALPSPSSIFSPPLVGMAAIASWLVQQHSPWLPLFSAPKGFLRAGSIYGFICSWVFGRREWFLILTNCTLPLVTQKSLFLKNISSASYFFWANTERIFSKKQYSLPIALLGFKFPPLISFSTLIKGCNTKIQEHSLCLPCTSQLF